MAQVVQHRFFQRNVNYHFNTSFSSFFQDIASQQRFFFVTDENLQQAHPGLFIDKKVFIFRAGEENKQQYQVDSLIKFLIEAGADKDDFLVGIGGGVVTDMTAYTASVYKRGMQLILFPTSLLAQVDASIGGKNGVDVGAYKNMVGTIYQPGHLVFDFSLLDTLPRKEWTNGFAEVIKHAAINDAEMFEMLETEELDNYVQGFEKSAYLIARNVNIKTNIVLKDEFETGDRKLLNFGHTIGHAIENTYNLPHGHAISIGMVLAARVSEKLTGLSAASTERLKKLLIRYGLPVDQSMDIDLLWQYLVNDKKKAGYNLNFVLLQEIGSAIYQSIPLAELYQYLQEIISLESHR